MGSLVFGTGGMRALMGAGADQINVDTVRAATQGLAQYVKRGTVFIGYDVRINSRLFAEEAAQVLAGNGLNVLITKEICPTPLVSFGCRHFHCAAAVMITASHNPPEYNGYKVYWSDGSQVVPPHDVGIMEEVKKRGEIQRASLDDPKIRWIGKEIDQAYFEELDRLALDRPQLPIKIVYTNLHGTGLRLVPTALARRGYTHLSLVKEQSSFDGHFPAAPHPNPEEESALALGSQQLLQEEADVLLATDPDADRVAAVIRHQNRAVRFNGHEVACLLLHHIATILKERGELSSHAAFVKSFVTTELARKIALDFGIACFDVPTGFKYIAQLIREWESNHEHEFLFGAEESLGYLFRSFVRDKDGISSACLVAEAVERAKRKGRTLLHQLYEFYERYGIHRQKLVSITSNKKVAQKEIHLENGKVIIRPSGTEPKIKIYGEIWKEVKDNLEQEIAECDQQLDSIILPYIPQ